MARSGKDLKDMILETREKSKLNGIAGNVPGEINIKKDSN
jgi:hypothetical protein